MAYSFRHISLSLSVSEFLLEKRRTASNRFHDPPLRPIALIQWPEECGQPYITGENYIPLVGRAIEILKFCTVELTH